MVFRIYLDKHMAEQGLPWAIEFSTPKGRVVHTASEIDVRVPSWGVKDLMSRHQAKYFWGCKGVLNWVGTKAIITGDTNEEEQKEAS